MELADRLRGVVDVLEHLDAGDEIEGGVLRRDRLDRADDVGVRVGRVVEPDVLGDVRREQRRVRLLAAARVEQAVAAEVGGCALRLLREPARERRAHGVRRHRERRVDAGV